MRALAITGLIFLLLLTALPHGLGLLMVYMLDRELGFTAQVENVDFNPFTGRMAIDNLSILGEHRSSLTNPSLAADLEMLSLLQGHLVAESISIEGLEISIEQTDEGHPVVLLALAQQGSSETTPVNIPLFALRKFELTNSLTQINAFGQKGSLMVDSLSLLGLSNMHAEPAELALKMDWQEARLEAVGALSIFGSAPAFSGDITLTGAQLKDLSPYMPEDITALAGTADLTLKGTLSEKTTEANVTLELSSIDIAYRHLEVLTQRLARHGPIEISPTAVGTTGNLSLEGLSIKDQSRSLLLGNLAKAEINALTVTDTTRIGFETARFTDFAAAGDDKGELLKAGDISIESFTYADNQLIVGSIESTGFASTLALSEDGELRSQGVLTASFNALQDEAGETAESAPLSWRIDNIQGRDGLVHFETAAMQAGHSVPIKVHELSLQALDNSHAEQSSPFLFDAGLGDYGSIRLEGMLSALDPLTSTQLKGEITSLPLPLLSPYSESLIGYELSSGQMDHQFDVIIQEQQLDAKNDIQLRQIKVTSVDTEPTQPLPIPLDLGLNMLRDSKDNISLKIPLSGDLNDPSVGVDKSSARPWARRSPRAPPPTSSLPCNPTAPYGWGRNWA